MVIIHITLIILVNNATDYDTKHNNNNNTDEHTNNTDEY